MVTLINGRWELQLPEHRAARPEWNYWEAHTLAVTHHLVTKMAGYPVIANRPVIWDIGSEEGDFTALYSLWGAEVVLVEPNPKVWPNIKWIWEANSLRPPVGWFVGLASDVTRLSPPEPREGLDGYILHGTPGDKWPSCADGEVIGDHGFVALFDGRDTIPQATLDTLRAHMPKPDLITMDIEGGEIYALKGASELLAQDRPILLVSLHPQFVGQDKTDELVADMMLVHKYHARHLCTDHEQHWVFVPREKAADWPGLVPA